MAVKYIKIYPTCDIHLLLNGPGGSKTTYQLHVRDTIRTDENLSADVAATKYTDNEPTIATISLTGLITPEAVGETFCRVRHTDVDSSDPANPKTFVSEIIVRIRVREDIKELWIGNNQVTLYEKEDNYVLSVYAIFNDDTIGDISSHPYLTFSPSNTGKVRINNTNDKGRMKGHSATGSTPVKIKVEYKALSDEVEAFVEPRLTAPKPILELIYGDGDFKKRRNILLLSEGFYARDKPLFRRIATLITNRLFTSQINTPYHILKDNFNVWAVFDPSPEEGISAGAFISKAGISVNGQLTQGGRPLPAFDIKPAKRNEDPNIDPDIDYYDIQKLIIRVGLPDRYSPIPTNRAQAEDAWEPIEASTDFTKEKVDDRVLNAWLGMREYHLLQARDSRFGFMNGARLGDRSSYQVDPADTKKDVMQWYLPDEPPHALIADRRRMHKNWDYGGLFSDYIKSLRLKNGGQGPIRVWEFRIDSDPPHVGKDRDLITYIVNSAYDGGIRGYIGIRVSTRQFTRYNELSVIGSKADHSLPEILPLHSFPVLLGTSIDEMTCVIAHEMAHAFKLGDEYEGYHDALKRNAENARKKINRYNNLISHYKIETAPADPDSIEISKVKWIKWHRIEQCSVLTRNSKSLSGNRVRIRVHPSEELKWGYAIFENLDVYLRSRNINVDHPEKNFFIKGPLKVQEFQSDGDVILTGTSSEDFKIDDVLYLPEIQENKPLTVFLPDTVSHFEGSKEPFAKKENPSKANEEPAYGLIWAFSSPRQPAFMVGVYEGGGTYNTKVYRPAGTCKMRTQERITVRHEKPYPIVLDADEIDEIFDFEPKIIVGKAREVKRYIPFCYVCKYSITNTVDPTKLDRLRYPE